MRYIIFFLGILFLSSFNSIDPPQLISSYRIEQREYKVDGDTHYKTYVLHILMYDEEEFNRDIIYYSDVNGIFKEIEIQTAIQKIKEHKKMQEYLVVSN